MLEPSTSITYLSPESDVKLKDYAVLFLENNNLRKRFLALVSKYSKEETTKKLEEVNEEILYHYQAGDEQDIPPYFIEFPSSSSFRIKQGV